MIFYQFTAKTKTNLCDQYKEVDDRQDIEGRVIKKLNNKGAGIKEENIPYLYLTHYVEQKLKGICIIPAIVTIQGKEKMTIRKFMKDFLEISVTSIICKEITAAQVEELVSDGYHQQIRAFRDKFMLRYESRSYFTIRQKVLEVKKYTKAEAMQKAEDILGGKSLKEEIERIYNKKNNKRFYGHPAHYKIVASSRECADEIIELLVNCLYNQGRLMGTRVEKISNIAEHFYDEDDIREMYSNAAGETVVLELSGKEQMQTKFASEYQEVANFVEELVKKNASKTLCIFVEFTNSPGLAKVVLENIPETVNIIEIREGKGDEKKAREYMNRLIKESELSWCKELTDQFFDFDKDMYLADDVRKMFSKNYAQCVTKYVYPSYQNYHFTRLEKQEEKGNSYKELKSMIGLTEVKNLVDQMISFYHMQKVKSNYKIKKNGYSMHMIFTGNPGSAKTTVARLLADIFAENEILETGKFVECGRSDLVGKYVGWTADIVKKKFQKARGGILFIDEAYALVDDSNSYGDEAINTIVQEMENMRDEVIVIFAGYPEKMKDFLNKNEGLRSRIAFHLDFPDYGEKELMEITQKLAKDRGYRISKKAVEHLQKIYVSACRQSEFGNGRYARNVLEQAIMKQSQRLAQSKKMEWKESELFSLRSEDFDVTLAKVEKEERRIGFMV